MKEDNAWIAVKKIENANASGWACIMLGNKFLGKELTQKLAEFWGRVKNRLKIVTFVEQKKNKQEQTFLKSDIYPLSLPLAPDDLKGWKPYSIFRGPTKGIKDLSCHISVLNKDCCPHLPHAHKEEELLLVLSGQVELIIPKEDLSGGNLRVPLKERAFVYYPAYFAHTIQTVSEQPANYLMFKWASHRKLQKENLFFKRYQMFSNGDHQEIKNGFQPKLIFEGKTKYLKKLHCHTSTLTTDAGYEPHVDPYDVAIIVLEGEVETLGKRAKAYDVIFYAASELHGMRNPGQQTAKYIIFEFHL